MAEQQNADRENFAREGVGEDNVSERGRRRRRGRRTLVVAAAVVAGVLAAGAAGAAVGFRVTGHGNSRTGITCPGGVSRLGHVLNESASLFPDDPETRIEIVATVEVDGYLVEKVTMGTHTGTHLDAPGHFIEGGRTVDVLTADELIWPVYVIDVRDRMAKEMVDPGGYEGAFQITGTEARAHMASWGGPKKFKDNAIVVLITGFEDKFATDDYEDPIPGLSAEAVQYFFDQGAKAIGTDNFGPDASSDTDFSATYTALENDGLVIPGLNNVADNLRTGDVMMASPVALEGGSSFQVDPLACHS